MNLEKIIQIPFPSNQVIQEEHSKNQIVIHHTAGGSVSSTINWWIKTPERVSTPIIIDRNGDVYQIYSSKLWAYHLGVKGKSDLDRHSIGVELANGGWDISQPYVKKIYTHQSDYRGYRSYEQYPKEQIESLRQLLLYWGERYNIDLTYHDDIFNVNQRALSGQNGLFSHTSYIQEKTDINPQYDMVEMLKSLKPV